MKKIYLLLIMAIVLSTVSCSSSKTYSNNAVSFKHKKELNNYTNNHKRVKNNGKW